MNRSHGYEHQAAYRNDVFDLLEGVEGAGQLRLAFFRLGLCELMHSLVR